MDDLMRAEDAAAKIGCSVFRLARAIQRGGLHDPIGIRVMPREWVVYRWETEGQRAAMHRRRLVGSVADAHK